MVWIDGGLHATETLGAQQLLEHVWQMVSPTDEETVRFLNDVIELCVLVNPERNGPRLRNLDMKHGNMNIPEFDNKDAGHDDNRDFYMAALAESTNIDRASSNRLWYPVNHVQPPPDRTPRARSMFAAPFRFPVRLLLQHPLRRLPASTSSGR